MSNYGLIVTQWILANIEWVFIALSATIFGALIIFIQINIKMSRMLRKYDKLMQGMEGKNLENVLFEHIDHVNAVVKKVDSMHDQYQRMSDTQEHCLQKIGIVRFNAFPDTGSDLSFSIAMLDAKNDGVMISSLFGRDESRMYGKPIQNGKSSYLLTDEEQEALQIAKRKK